MNRQIVKFYIEEYKSQFKFIHKEEIYKWQAVKQFQDNWNIDATDFYSMLENSLKLVGNLLDSGQYFPKRMLLKNTEKTPERIRTFFKYLFDEDFDILERIELFRSDFKTLNGLNFTNLNDYQDHRAVIVYLVLKYPERYFFYKQRMFKEFSRKVDYNYNPIAGRIENIGQFQNLCNLLRHELSKDQELLKLHKNRIADNCYYDENLNILTQDFMYAVVRHLKTSRILEIKEVKETVPTKINSAEIEVVETEIDFTPRTVNYIQNNIENKRIGDLGELWAINFEKKKLLKADKLKLAEKVKHVAKDKGDGLGYDILSFDIDGKEIYIEVKTTKGNANSTFFITRNELERSKTERQSFYLYRVFNYNEETDNAELLIIKGDLTYLCEVPWTYKVNIKNKEKPVGNKIYTKEEKKNDN